MNPCRTYFGLILFVAVVLLTLPEPQVRSAQDKDKTITNSVGMKLALIPAGKFMMGSPLDEVERDPEELLHEVTISKPFYIGVFEVTQAEYEKVTGKKPPALFTKERGGGPNHPVEQVAWGGAVAFCQTLNDLAPERQANRRYRLPTEAEWEYACRAGTQTPFHFGKSLSSKQANFNGNYPYGDAAKDVNMRATAKVGSYPSNAFGLYDMHGNVSEWCGDFYDPDYYKAGPKTDPPGPDKGVIKTSFQDKFSKDEFFRVVRGGCWLDEARGCRSAYRSRFQPTDPYRIIGFRVVCEVGKSRK